MTSGGSFFGGIANVCTSAVDLSRYEISLLKKFQYLAAFGSNGRFILSRTNIRPKNMCCTAVSVTQVRTMWQASKKKQQQPKN